LWPDLKKWSPLLVNIQFTSISYRKEFVKQWKNKVSRKFVNYSNTYFQYLNFVSCPRQIQIMPTHFTSSTISKDQISCSLDNQSWPLIDGISESLILFQLQKSSIARLKDIKSSSCYRPTKLISWRLWRRLMWCFKVQCQICIL